MTTTEKINYKHFVLSYPLIKSHFMEFNPLSDIPNQEGYHLVVLTNRGMQFTDFVVKDKDGCHKLDMWKCSDLKGWRELTQEDVNLCKVSE